MTAEQRREAARKAVKAPVGTSEKGEEGERNLGNLSTPYPIALVLNLLRPRGYLVLRSCFRRPNERLGRSTAGLADKEIDAAVRIYRDVSGFAALGCSSIRGVLFVEPMDLEPAEVTFTPHEKLK